MSKKRIKPVPQHPEVKTRKQLRKEKRKLKKLSKSNYFDSKRSKFVEGNKKSTNILPKNKKESNKIESNNKIKSDVSKGKMHLIRTKSSINEATLKKTHDKLLDKMKNQRKRQLLDANIEDEKEIKFLGKKLKLDNKKTVSTSKGFVDSGLDYILDVCDPERIHDSLAGEVNFEDSDSDFYEDYSMVQDKEAGTKNKKLHLEKTSVGVKKSSVKANNFTVPEKSYKKPQFNVEFSKSLEGDSGSECLEDEFEDESGSEKIEDESDLEKFEDESDLEKSEGESDLEKSEDESDLEKSEDNKKEDDHPILKNNPEQDNEVWEDIYGRLRDKKGNILEHNRGKYIPPHLRDSGNTSEKQKELLRILKGLLNRLALNNMHSIANEVEGLFLKHSRHSVNEALFSLFIDSIVLPVMSPERLIIDHAMLIAILHGNVGSEIGANMLQNLIDKFVALSGVDQPVENKQLDNLLLLISYLYNFKVFEACLMYDILNKMCIQLTEKNIDLILVVLKSVGFSLRKDDPLAMKGFLLAVQMKVNKTTDIEDRSRMKYMLEVLLNIKNNNISKLSDFDPSQHEHLKKVLKSVLRSGNSIVALRVGLDDLLNVEERGRWWLVGSAWNKSEQVENIEKENAPLEQFSAQLLDLARKQKMNTENRRNLFCILMSAEDYHDAFEKVLKLGLKGQQEREIPLVIVHCLLQEKNYNPYYAHIADQLCTSNRRHQMSLQCALWDRFRALEKLSSTKISVLAKFLAQLVIAGSLPISVLKVVEFTELDKRHIRLLRQTILSIAKEEALESVKEVFERVSKSKKLSLFREALRLFIHHFILRNMPDGELKERILLINSILSGDIS